MNLKIYETQIDLKSLFSPPSFLGGMTFSASSVLLALPFSVDVAFLSLVFFLSLGLANFALFSR